MDTSRSIGDHRADPAGTGSLALAYAFRINPMIRDRHGSKEV
jgi:hypothetical protein